MEKIIFMGTPEFARTILDGLINENKYNIVAAVTQPDRPVGRKRVLTAPPVKQLAVEHGIPVYQPEKITGSDAVQELIDLNADIIITAAYGQFVPTKLINAPKHKAINVHASLLPKYRGGAPIHYAIWEGEEETGISLIYMTKKMDAGEIIAQAKTPIAKTDDVGDLFTRLATIGRDLLLEELPNIFEGNINPWPQDEAEVTFSPTIPREQEQVNWHQTATQIDQHVRAFRPFPTTYTWLDDKRTKIVQGQPAEGTVQSGKPVGTIIGAENGVLTVQTGEDTAFHIEKWQESGKKAMLVKDYLNGVKPEEIIGQQFEVKD